VTVGHIGTHDAQSTVRIDSDLVEQLRAYSEKSGVPITKAINEAVSVYIECFIPPRLEALEQQRGKMAEVKPFKTPAKGGKE
jgi:Ribbon-helix-helix domain